MAKLEGQIAKITRVQPTVLAGSVAVVGTIVIFYGVPLLWWLFRYALSDATVLPKDLPLRALISRTLMVSSVAGVCALFAAYPLVLIWRLSPPFIKQVINFLMVIPMIMGLLARNYSWIGMLSADRALPSMGWSQVGGQQFLYTTLSVYVVMSCIFVPIAFFILIQGASSVSNDHLDAARTLGVPDWKIVLVVVLPLTLRAATLAFGLILAMSVGFFITPRMIGGGKSDFVSNAVLTYVNYGRFGVASALALAFLAVMAFPIVLITLYAFRRRLLTTGR